MNNKEAIEAIKSNWPTLNYTILIEALNKAVKLLEKNTTEIDCPNCGGHGYFDSSRTAEVKCNSCTDGRVKAIILED